MDEISDRRKTWKKLKSNGVNVSSSMDKFHLIWYRLE